MIEDFPLKPPRHPSLPASGGSGIIPSRISRFSSVRSNPKTDGGDPRERSVEAHRLHRSVAGEPSSALECPQGRGVKDIKAGPPTREGQGTQAENGVEATQCPLDLHPEDLQGPSRSIEVHQGPSRSIKVHIDFGTALEPITQLSTDNVQM